MTEEIRNLTFQEKFIGVFCALIVTLMSWTALNTHETKLHMAVYEAVNVAEHTTLGSTSQKADEEIESDVKAVQMKTKSLENRVTKLETSFVFVESVCEKYRKLKN